MASGHHSEPPGDSDDAAGGSGGPRVVVTGAAGFIGSHLVGRLLDDGADVVGVDNLDPWYAPERKAANAAASLLVDGYRLHDVDLLSLDLVSLLTGVDTVYHLAARPGVQDSWGSGFAATCHLNVAMTQHLFEACLAAGVGRVVLASSSSVYGDGAASGRREIAPVSPYGVSKAAAEQLAAVYGRRGLDVVSLRYFTVFGPRQRPDMAMHRLFASCLGGPVFRKRGTGDQQREFTFVDDVVAATIAAGTVDGGLVAGEAFDIGGGCETSLNEVIEAITEVAGTPPVVESEPGSAGDPSRTVADIGPTSERLGWAPQVELLDGLTRQWHWHQSIDTEAESSVGASSVGDSSTTAELAAG